MTRVSERLRNKPQLETEKLLEKPRANKRSGNVWTDEEYKELLESLKVHNWNEWNAVASDVKTRPAGGIESKVRKLANSSYNEKDSALRKELIEIAKMVQMSGTSIILLNNSFLETT